MSDTRMHIVKFLFLVCCVALVAGCGFHLRGKSPVAINFSRVYLDVRGAHRIAAEVKQQLQYNQIALAPEKKWANLILTLSNERFDERVLSVDPLTGKVREFELGYRVTFSARPPKGKRYIARESIDLLRDVTFDETAVLGKFDEQEVVRKEMLKDAADAILRRLESVKVESPSAKNKR